MSGEKSRVRLMADFVAHISKDNFGIWGPSNIPMEFTSIPFQPFSRGDKIGKISDWSNAQDKKYSSRYTSTFTGGEFYSYTHEENNDDFVLVDSSRFQKGTGSRNKNKYMQNKLRRDRLQQQKQVPAPILKKQPMVKKKKSQVGATSRWTSNQNNERRNQILQKKPSVPVKDHWKLLLEWDLTHLSKLRTSEIPEVSDVYWAGSIKMFDQKFNSITSKFSKTLLNTDLLFYKSQILFDPVVRKNAHSANVFISDSLFAALMSSPKSANPWDMVLQRVADKLFVDKRDESDLDLLSVHETAFDPPFNNGINMPSELAIEATSVNHDFSQQCLHQSKKMKLKHPHPFHQDSSSTGKAAHVGYRYRVFKLPNDISVMVRCELDAYEEKNSSKSISYLSVKSFLEWDSKSSGLDWRSTLDSQSGSVLASEIKSNANKVAKWACSASFSDVRAVKIGFISRNSFASNSSHSILGVTEYSPKDLATLVNLSMENCWAIVQHIFDACLKLPDGKYLLMRDHVKASLNLYQVSETEFEECDEEMISAEQEHNASDFDDESVTTSLETLSI